MRFVYSMLLALALPLCLTACGEEETTDDNPFFGNVDGVSPSDMEEAKRKWQDALKKGGGIDPKIANELKERFKDMNLPTNEAEAKEWMKGMGGSVTEAELEQWWSVQKLAVNAKTAAGAQAYAAAVMKAGAKYALLRGKVMPALGLYKSRKKAGALTDTDRKMAAVYDKYLALLESIGKKR